MFPGNSEQFTSSTVLRFLRPRTWRLHVGRITLEWNATSSYGYRPGKSAKEALGVARQRCWRNDWVLDLDIKAFFETIDHGLLMRAVRRHTTCIWQLADGSLIERTEGTPQGGVVSPILANLYLHSLLSG